MKLTRWLRMFFGRTYVSQYSRTKTKRCGYVTAFGITRFLKLPLNNEGTVDFTVREIEQATTRCAWCGGPIFAWDSITLLTPMRDIPGTMEWYGPRREPIPKAEAEIKQFAVIYQDDPLQLVGCSRYTCCDLMDTCGMWIPDSEHPGQGKVHRMPSVIERLLANPDAGGAIANRTGSGPLDISLIGNRS